MAGDRDVGRPRTDDPKMKLDGRYSLRQSMLLQIEVEAERTGRTKNAVFEMVVKNGLRALKK